MSERPARVLVLAEDPALLRALSETAHKVVDVAAVSESATYSTGDVENVVIGYGWPEPKSLSTACPRCGRDFKTAQGRDGHLVRYHKEKL